MGERKRDLLRKRLFEFAKRPFKCPLGTGIFVLGLAGIQDDVATWQKWIDKVTRDEQVLALAYQAASVAQWINQPAVRWVLVAAGFLLILWRLPWFWNLRHKLVFAGRSLLSSQVWINRESALDILQNSTWGQLKRPVVGFAENLSMAFAGGGLTDNQKRLKKYAMYIELTLESFETNNPNSVKAGEDGSPEYEEGALRKFTRAAIQDEVISDFGEIPSRSV